MSFRFDLIKHLRGSHSGQVTGLVLQSILVGIVAGLGALIFSHTLEVTSDLLIEHVSGVQLPVEGHYAEITPAADGSTPAYHYIRPPLSKRLWILIIPALGGLICGWLVFTFAPEAEGHGTDSVIDAFHNKQGKIRKRIPIIKLLASVMTLSSGGSAGREGPIAQVSAGFGSFLADLLKLSARQRRILVVAGVGAGVGAMFRAPLGGALFAVDVLYRDTEFEYEALIPAFIASITSYTTFAALTPAGMGHIFDIPTDLVFNDPSHLLLCVVFAVVLAFMGWIYVKVFYGVTAFFKNQIRVPQVLKPAIGGLVIGLIGFVDPRLLTTGYGWVQQALDGNLALGFICILVISKIVMTAVTIGSGGSGGVFGPSIVIGGLIGGAFGSICQRWIPNVQPAVFVCLGMAGFFSGAAKTPISTIFMVSEMTVGYVLLLPLMLVSSLTYLLSPERVTLYVKQVRKRLDSPAHLGDFVVDVLRDSKVEDILESREFIQIPQNMLLLPLLEMVAESTQTVFPLVDDNGHLQAIIRLNDLRGSFAHPEINPLVIAEDLAFHRFEPLLTSDSLNIAMQKLSHANCSELPVVDKNDPSHVLGILSRREILQLYSARMESLLRESTPAQ